MITFSKNEKPEPKKAFKIKTDEEELVFPERTVVITDRWGNKETYTTRQKTIYRNGKSIIWTDADIEYYEKLQAKIAELKELDEQMESMSLKSSIEELINEPETV